MLAIALPELRERFDVGHGTVTWLVSSYLIAMAVAQPVGGRIGDQIGRARTFRVGLVAFLAFSIGCALAPNFVTLVAMRTGQAIVGAAIIPNGMAMLRVAVPEHRFGEASGTVGSALGFSAALGPLLGAAILETSSWRVLFLLNLPLVLAALLSLYLLRYQDDQPRRSGARIDLPGIGGLIVLLVLVTHVLSSWQSGETVAIAAAVGALIIVALVFVWSQRKAALPLVDWRFFRVRSFAAGSSFILLSNLVMYTTLLTLPFFIDEVQGRSAAEAGSLIAILALLMASLALVSGRLSDLRGRRGLAVLGAVAMVASSSLLALVIDADAAFYLLAIPMLLLGLGIGLGTGPATTAAIESVPRETAGAASGTISMMRYFGSIVGAAAMSGILSSGDVPDVAVYRLIFLVLTVTGVLATLAALRLHVFFSPPQRPTA
jgi:EmrB/QacA subfamily drug resistance transporter